MMPMLLKTCTLAVSHILEFPTSYIRLARWETSCTCTGSGSVCGDDLIHGPAPFIISPESGVISFAAPLAAESGLVFGYSDI